MAKSNNKPTSLTVETLVHDEATRKNIPTAEYQSVMQKDERSPVRVAYERRNRDLDPQLVWRGKDGQDASDLVVNAPPLYIQEKVHPKALIDDLGAARRARRRAARARPTRNWTSSPTSTACPTPTPGPSSTATTATGPTA